MKKLLSSKLFWTVAILSVAGTIMYTTTWGNKTWLINQIIDRGGATDSQEKRAELAKKDSSELRKQLKNLY